LFNKWRSQQNEHKPDSQLVKLAHLPKEPLCAKKAIFEVGSPKRQKAREVLSSVSSPKCAVGAESLEPVRAPVLGSSSGLIERDDKSAVRTIKIILEPVNRRGRSRASLPDGTVLVASSRQPFLDAARVLIAAGYDADSWLEGWRAGAKAFALRARLGAAAGLTVDETKTGFAKWKPFSSSAVAASIDHSKEAATTLPSISSALLRPPLDPSFSNKEVESIHSAPPR
jgi:hypothetical protein